VVGWAEVMRMDGGHKSGMEMWNELCDGMGIENGVRLGMSLGRRRWVWREITAQVRRGLID